jgi:modulator of FtsH protease HflC
MQRLLVPVALLVLLVLILASGMLYRVDETEQVIITQFGEPVGKPVITPGLKVKMPFIQTVRRFDKRVLEWDGSPDQIPTLDKRFILVDTTARWRIVDPLLFFQAVGDERSAQSRLDDASSTGFALKRTARHRKGLAKPMPRRQPFTPPLMARSRSSTHFSRP